MSVWKRKATRLSSRAPTGRTSAVRRCPATRLSAAIWCVIVVAEHTNQWQRSTKRRPRRQAVHGKQRPSTARQPAVGCLLWSATSTTTSQARQSLHRQNRATTRSKMKETPVMTKNCHAAGKEFSLTGRTANNLPSLDAETSAAIQVAGVSEAAVRLTGDTFNKFKGEYRKLSGPDRMQVLSTLQLRVAAIYALQNEDMQRNRRQEAQDRRHRDIESNKRPHEGGAASINKRQRPRMVHGQEAGTEALQNQMPLDVAHGLMGATQFQLPPRAPPQIQLAHAAAQTSLSIPNSGMGGFPQFANSSSRGRRPHT